MRTRMHASPKIGGLTARLFILSLYAVRRRQPSWDVTENLERFLVHSVQAMGMTLN